MHFANFSPHKLGLGHTHRNRYLQCSEDSFLSQHQSDLTLRPDVLLGGLHSTPEEQVRLATHAGRQFLRGKGLGTGGRCLAVLFEPFLTVQLLSHQVPVGARFVVVESTENSDAPNQAVHIVAVGLEAFLFGFLDGVLRSLKDFGALLAEATVVVLPVDDRRAVVEQLENESGFAVQMKIVLKFKVGSGILTNPTRRTVATKIFIVYGGEQLLMN